MSPSTPTVFAGLLRDHQLLAPEHLEALSGVAAEFPDAPALTRELVRRGWLTNYQAEILLQGDVKDLTRGPYRLLAPLGEGAMGQVFKARHADKGHVVALKLLLNKESFTNPRAMQRFTREIRAAALLNHPHIVRACDANLAGNTPYLALEYVEGADLARLVKHNGPLPAALACEYARQAALGLQHAHDHGLVHRDVKPHNLMLARTAEGRPPVVKILDFGLARFEVEADQAGRLTQSGKILGTVDYMSPEQATDARHVDIRSDIYGLGCTLFFLLAGKPPFPGDDMVEKLSARLLGDPPSVRDGRPDVPAAVEKVVLKMMARDPAGRYQSPGQVAEALGPFARITRLARPATPAPALRPEDHTTAPTKRGSSHDGLPRPPWRKSKVELRGSSPGVQGRPAAVASAAPAVVAGTRPEVSAEQTWAEATKDPESIVAPHWPQHSRKPFTGRRRLWMFVGTAGGALVSAVVVAFALLPAPAQKPPPTGGNSSPSIPPSPQPPPPPIPPGPPPPRAITNSIGMELRWS